MHLYQSSFPKTTCLQAGCFSPHHTFLQVIGSGQAYGWEYSPSPLSMTGTGPGVLELRERAILLPKEEPKQAFWRRDDIAESGDRTPRHGNPGMQDVARDRGKQLTTGGSGPRRILQDFKPGSHGRAMRPLEPDAYCGCSVRQTMQMQPRSTKTWNVGGHAQTHLTSK